MKLASLKGDRDGVLIVVSRDLKRAVVAAPIAPTLQAALENWPTASVRLQALYDRLNAGTARGSFAFNPVICGAPLPRAAQWLDGSAYVNHVELVRKARGAELPPSFWTDPLMYQGASDAFIGAMDPIEVANPQWGIDFESEIAVVTDDVPMGVPSTDADRHIKLLMLVNDVSLRGLIPAELAKGFGFVHGKPATSFSPVAVTPDELGDAWHDGTVHLPLLTSLNGEPFGKPEAGQDMTFSFPNLVAHAAKTRHLSAGTIIGSGTVSNKQDTAHGSAIADGGVGYSCIAEIRMIETINNGAPQTPFMAYGDKVRIEMLGTDGASLFGAIEQAVVPYTGP